MSVYNNPNDYWLVSPEDEQPNGGCLVAICYAMVFAAILAMLILCSGCETVRYVQVPITHTDTLWKSTMSYDSVYVRDSIHIKEKGDTVWIDRWHTKFVSKEMHDTLYKSRVDTVGVPYPIEKMVEKELSWWQKVKMWMGVWFMVLIGVAVVWVVCIKTRR